MYSRTMPAATFAQLCAHFGVTPARNGWADAPCPGCGHRVVKGTVHFHFNEQLAKCFACGYRASLAGLAKRLQLGDVAPVTIPPPRPRVPKAWQREPEVYIRRWTAALDSVSEWQRYKPLSLDTIARWELGVGILPACSCTHRRLVYPVRIAGKVIALRGRRLDCECPQKVIMAAGSCAALFNVDGLRPGVEVLICENPIDAMLAMQLWPDVVALAIGGASMWRPEWTEAVATVKPARVVAFPDNDTAGYAGAAKVANALLGAGVNATVARWASTYPPKYDLGSFLGDLMAGDRVA